MTGPGQASAPTEPKGPTLGESWTAAMGHAKTFADRETIRNAFTREAVKDTPSYMGKTAPKYLDPKPELRGPNVVDSKEYATYLGRIANDMREQRLAREKREREQREPWWCTTGMMMGRQP